MKLKNIIEMVERKRVVRKNKWIIKFTTNRPGYKVKNVKGRRTEVRMKPEEVRKRERAAKKAARKRAGKMSSISAKRKRSLAKRG